MTPDESLLTLLRSHQDGVYTVCLHVLRNSHDAEDAAQEAMLKVASGAKDLRDPRAFKSWLYRLVFRTAVDHARRRATRRRIEEGSVPMSSGTLTDEQRDAIHEAMAALPDDDRLMLVEHYFEKVPIVELGRREGVSDVAMGKRLEKAREKLKRGLAGAGILLAATQVSHALESVTWVSAPVGLASKTALVAAGGIVVGTKFSSPVILLLAILALGIGTGGGYMIAARRSNDSHRVRELEREVASLKARSINTDRIAPVDRKVEVPAATNETAAPPAKSKLAATLERYKSLRDRHNAKWKAWSEENPGKGIDAIEMGRDFRAMAKELEGIRAQILEDPATFLEFLSRAENQGYVWNLFDVTLARRVDDSIMQQPFAGLPTLLSDGLLGLLKTGSDTVRDQVLRFMQGVTGQPDEFKSQYLAMLSDSNTNLIGPAARALANTSPLSETEFERLTTVCENSGSRDVRQGIVASIWWMQTPEAREWLLTSLESGRMPDMDASLAAGLNIHLRSGPGEAFEERLSRATSAALARSTDEVVYFQLLQTSPYLPSSAWKSHFELAATQGPTLKVRDVASRCLELINSGRADRKTLGTILNDAQKKH